MKTITTTVYSPRELKEANPDAFDKALERWQRDEGEYIPWADETIESLKAMIKATGGIALRDWSLGMDSYSSYVKIEWPYWNEDDRSDLAKDYTGQRAYNWLKANLLHGATFRRVTYDKRKGGKGWRYDITKRDGKPWSCEFTGYCADHDFIESVLDDIRTGSTLEEAYNNLASTCAHVLEQEYTYATSEEAFLDSDCDLTLDGRMFRG